MGRIADEKPTLGTPDDAVSIGSPKGRGLLQGRIAGLRFASLGSGPWPALPDHLEVDHSWIGSVATHADNWLDVLLVDAAVPGWTEEELVTVVAEARQIGARVVVSIGAGSTPAWCEDGELVTATLSCDRPGGLCLPVAVDMSRFNPAGYRRVESGAVSRVTVGEADPAAVLDSLGKAAGISLHQGSAPPQLTASWAAALAATGIPVVDAPDATLPVSTELETLIRNASEADVTDANNRDRISVAMRRTALRDHAAAAVLAHLAAHLGLPVPPPPRISVIIPTRRPDFLTRALTQVNRQNYPNIELIMVLRDREFPAGAETQIAQSATVPTTVIRAPADLVLGEALNLGLAAATGDLVTKMDDDDWYGADHLWDLVLAMEYSGAAVVGKAAEFVYLEDLDLTVRRKIKGAEQNAPTVAGGAFLIGRETLRRLGGWPRLPFAEDFHLMGNVQNAGGVVYRTHGFGYILNRHRSNTWEVDPQAFVRGAGYQWPGLNLEMAGI